MKEQLHTTIPKSPEQHAALDIFPKALDRLHDLVATTAEYTTWWTSPYYHMSCNAQLNDSNQAAKLIDIIDKAIACGASIAVTYPWATTVEITIGVVDGRWDRDYPVIQMTYQASEVKLEELLVGDYEYSLTTNSQQDLEQLVAVVQPYLPTIVSDDVE